jgi:hypothetical protein
VVPTRYGRQAILDEFGGLRRCNISASIDSNRVVDVKHCCVMDCVLCIGKSVVHLYFVYSHVEAFHHTQSILLYGQAARAISIG